MNRKNVNGAIKIWYSQSWTFRFRFKIEEKKDLNDFENISRHAWNCEFLLSLFNFYSKKNKFFKPVAADMYASCKHDNWIWRKLAPKCRQNRNNLNEKKPRLLTDRRSDTDMSWFHRLHSLLLLYSVCWGHHWIKSSSFSVWFGLVLVNFLIRCHRLATFVQCSNYRII